MPDAASSPPEPPATAEARLERFAREETASLYSLFCRVTGNAETAQDLLQDTLAEAWRQLRRYDSTRPFRNWVFRLGQNRLRNHLRRRRLEARWMQPLTVDPPDRERRAAGARGLGEELEHVLETLPYVQRVAVVLRYEEDLSCAEIGEILEMTPNAVSIQLYHARRALKVLLEAGAEESRP